MGQTSCPKSPARPDDRTTGCDGWDRGQVIAGEVKTKAPGFTDGQIARDAKLSHRLGADTHLPAAVDDVPSDIAASTRRPVIC
jgi:hypothetical protein